MIKQIDSLLTGFWLTDLANISAFIKSNFENISWSGFYLLKDGELVLGPFVGEVACTNIKIGKGVCGKSFGLKKPINVPNVDDFEGHIACDYATKSELVVPLISNNTPWGVLDLDSYEYNRFKNPSDEKFFIEVADLVTRRIEKVVL